MNIEQREVGDVMVLSISGDIRLTEPEVAQLTSKVRMELQQGQTRFILDLGRVRYVDSFGLGELVHAFSAVRSRGGELKLLNVTSRLNDLLLVTKLLTVFECFDQESKALASFGEPAVARGGRA